MKTETVSLARSSGRVLAANVLATDLPPFDNSSVDGFAVRAADLTGHTRENGRRLAVVADVPAGATRRFQLRRDQAARIMTGARIPSGADAVVMLEDTDAWGQPSGDVPPTWIKVQGPVAPGANIRRRGTHLRRGQTALTKGTRLRPQDVGMLAMLNREAVTVFRRPRVAVLSGGDELGVVGQPLKPGHIPDSNSHTLAALVAGAGCEVLPLGIARDRAASIASLLDRAVRAHVDMILSSAGVSVGALDLVRRVIASRGQIDFWRVNVRPGKPLAVGSYRRVPFIGLPGNPVSAFVGFELFVRPALARLSGQPSPERRILSATLDEPVEGDGRETYLRAILKATRRGPRVRLAGNQGSADLFSLVRANALLIIPAGVKSLAVGDPVRVWLV